MSRLTGNWEFKLKNTPIYFIFFYIICKMELPPMLKNKQTLVKLIGKMFKEILQNANEDTPSSPYHAKQIPKTSIFSYLQRISKYMNCSHAVFVIALIYIDRLQNRLKDSPINSFCIHKLFISSIVLAAKYNDDEYFKNSYYAKIGGLKIEELNKLEIAFCADTKFTFYVSVKEFENYLDKLKKYSKQNP